MPLEAWKGFLEEINLLRFHYTWLNPINSTEIDALYDDLSLQTFVLASAVAGTSDIDGQTAAATQIGAKYLVFVSSCSDKMREFISYACILLEESEFIFQFLNDKMHNYVKQNLTTNFNIQKLKSKHTFLKKYTN